MRSVSSDRLGRSCPATEPISGTRRTIPSTSGVERHQPEPRGGLRERGQRAGQAGKFRQELARILAQDHHRRRPQLGAIDRVEGGRDRGHAQHHLIAGHGLGHPRIVVRQAAQRRRKLRRDPFDLAGEDRRRIAVAFGEQDVAGDRSGAVVAQLVEQLREHRARPRPLADSGEARIVDVDDGDRQRLLGWARMEGLQLVEDLVAEGLDHRRVGEMQHHEQHHQQRSDDAGRQVDATGIAISNRAAGPCWLLRSGHAVETRSAGPLSRQSWPRRPARQSRRH